MRVSLSDSPVSHEGMGTAGLGPASVMGRAGIVRVHWALHTGNLALRMTRARGNFL